MARASAYLLDTNILVHLIRGDALGKAIETNFALAGSLSRSLISVVTVGEMYSLARRWGWGQNKLDQLQALLSQLVWIDLNHPDILETYAELEDISHRAGRSMDKNSLWIAATAKVSGTTLLTLDSDFDHLAAANLSLVRVDGKTGQAIP
jgi:tRNA(fMet)-specific endonuclease VapC